MRILRWVTRTLLSTALIGFPLLVIAAHSPSTIGWFLLANANMLLMLAVCGLLFATRYA